MTNNNELYSIFYNIISELAEDLKIFLKYYIPIMKPQIQLTYIAF